MFARDLSDLGSLVLLELDLASGCLTVAVATLLQQSDLWMCTFAYLVVYGFAGRLLG